MPRAFVYGHECEWDGREWIYADTRESADGHPRPCPQCGKLPTPEGYDACLGHIPGAASACCGHGKFCGYINWPGVSAPDGWWRGAYVIEP